MTEQSVMPELDVFNLPVFGVADLFLWSLKMNLPNWPRILPKTACKSRL